MRAPAHPLKTPELNGRSAAGARGPSPACAVVAARPFADLLPLTPVLQPAKALRRRESLSYLPLVIPWSLSASRATPLPIKPSRPPLHQAHSYRPCCAGTGGAPLQGRVCAAICMTPSSAGSPSPAPRLLIDASRHRASHPSWYHPKTPELTGLAPSRARADPCRCGRALQHVHLRTLSCLRPCYSLPKRSAVVSP